MTLDGRGAFPDYPGSDQPTGNPDEPDLFFRNMWTDRYDDVTTVVMGRRSFVGHNRVHSLKGRKPNAPKFMHAYSRFLEDVDKVCLSRTLKDPKWANSRILKGDLSKVIAKLKKEKGGNIIIEGGPRLIFDVLKLGLADDYWILVMPVVYGKGPRYWGQLANQRTLKLLSSNTMKFGELVLHYETVR
jgi:dihydrofolate reductase